MFDVTHDVCIESNLIGHEKHIIFTVNEKGLPENICLTDKLPNDSFVLLSKNSRKSPDIDLSLNVAMELEYSMISVLPSNEKYINKATQLKLDPSSGSVKWSIMMDPDDYKVFVKKLVFDTAKTIHSMNFEYFYGTYGPTTKVFHELRRPFVDPAIMNSTDSSIKNTLEHAIINKNGLCNKIVYSRNSTRTGRLKVVDGINVLTFPKSSRSFFVSSYKNGVIVSIDFKSIEARVAWTSSKRNCETDDIYNMINDEYFKGKLPRSIVKQAVLALLYGQGYEALSKDLNCTNDNARKFITLIKEKFNVASVLHLLGIQFELESFIRNGYGRKIRLSDSKPHIMYNSYVQSTAMDAVLLGILNLLNNIDPDIRPLFMIHDEIYVDCPIDLFESLSKKSDEIIVQLHGYDVKLPTKVEIISNG